MTLKNKKKQKEFERIIKEMATAMRYAHRGFVADKYTRGDNMLTVHMNDVLNTFGEFCLRNPE